MTQIHIIPGSSSKIDIKALARSTSKIRRALVSQNAQFSLGRKPPGSWYIQHIDVGIYRVVHNLNRIDYGVAVSKVTDELLSVETSELTSISFTVKITKEGEPINRPFEFALNMQDEDV